MNIVTLGIDLAKNIFALHGVDNQGHVVFIKPRVARDQLLSMVANLPPCLIGMEACTGAHHWARVFSQHGHIVRLMAPKFVAPYRMSGKRGKNDAADAAAICEAVTRPNMRFVPVKDTHQQALLSIHRTRQGFVEERTACYNRLRGLIAEFGIVLPQKVERLRREIDLHLDILPDLARRCVLDLLTHADALDERITAYDALIQCAAKQDDRSLRLMQIPGIGHTTASALVASLGNGHDFESGRQLAAWVGLVPGQCSSGGKPRLGRITKAGDAYLRSLLVMGARAVMVSVGDKQDRFSCWVRSLVERRGYWKAAIAIAAKNLRLVWAALKYGDDFKLYSKAV